MVRTINTLTGNREISVSIKSFNITNVVIVVVRYFGGTKLGASGLIHAYKTAAKEALDNANIVENFIYTQYLFNFGYDHMGHILSVIKENNISVSNAAALRMMERTHC